MLTRASRAIPGLLFVGLLLIVAALPLLESRACPFWLCDRLPRRVLPVTSRFEHGINFPAATWLLLWSTVAIVFAWLARNLRIGRALILAIATIAVVTVVFNTFLSAIDKPYARPMWP